LMENFLAFGKLIELTEPRNYNLIRTIRGEHRHDDGESPFAWRFS
jgi:hypothetical protein